MNFRTPIFLSSFLLVLCSGSGWSLTRAQGAEAEPEDQLVRDPGGVALGAGRRALAEGRTQAALGALLDALALGEEPLTCLTALLEVAAGDADAKALWSLELLNALADEEGRVQLTGEQRRLLAPQDRAIAQLPRTRARAVRELIALAGEREELGAKRPSERLVARWARRLALLLVEDTPSLRSAHGASLSPWLTRDEGAHRAVLTALEKEIKAAFGERQGGRALVFARVLRGLATQANFRGLVGPKPRAMARWARSAQEAVVRARQIMEQDGEAPWSVEDLEWLTEEEAEAFTRAHREWSNPGRALSPSGWYRIETVCGHGTLLGVAATVEQHHRRLVNWYGRDPFVDREGVMRRGTVRIVPEASGLEQEGAPFWWAGGFQGGDTTTLRFSTGTIEGLGHGLIHELTHRFDGAIYPGQPAWLTEGKAVWTAAAFGSAEDTEFVTDHVLVGTVEAAFVKGYGGEAKLRELVSGELEEYRDNYTAGYALYVFLDSWRTEAGGARLFQGRLQHFMEHAAEGSARPVEFFEQHFCDGQEGRPTSFEEFAALFGTFVRGFYWKSRAPFVAWYAIEVPRGQGGGLVFDEPTWGWSRQRAEPVFGQDQLRAAGLLLLDARRTRAGITALVEGLARDGRSPAAEERLIEVLAWERQRDAAWALETLLALPAAGAPGPPPFLKRLGATQAHLQALRSAVDEQIEQGRALAAVALAADLRRLARHLGLEKSELVADLPSFAGGEPGDLLHPLATAPLPVARDGWSEDRLVGFEERRVEGLWFEDDLGALHVGRRRARHATGRTERASHQRQAFVRSRLELLPGTYRLRARIAFTTSFVSGQVVFGFEHRDRNLRFGFRAGDFLYSIGESDEEPTFESMGWSLMGGRERDGVLAGSQPAGRVEFSGRRSGFELELLVDGAAVEARIDGELVGRYHTVDGAPIEGSVGFAVSTGAFVVRSLSVQRLDRLRLGEARYPEPLAVDLGAEELPYFDDLENRPLLGLEPPPNGLLLLWIAADYREEGEPFDAQRVLARAVHSTSDLERQLLRLNLPQGLRVIVPEALGSEGLAELRERLAVEIESPPAILTHRLDGLPGLAADGRRRGEESDFSKRWLLFVDGRGILRIARPYLAQADELEPRLVRWLEAFRDNGQPERMLPEPQRLSGETTPGDD